MRVAGVVALAVVASALLGCAQAGPTSPALRSGVVGQVHLGPQCPVETVDDPCADEPAAGVSVTVSRQLPGEAYTAGEVVARATTGADGGFRVAVAPGEYVVTADAGMSCELMDARVRAGSFTAVDVPCDTGIR